MRLFAKLTAIFRIANKKVRDINRIIMMQDLGRGWQRNFYISQLILNVFKFIFFIINK